MRDLITTLRERIVIGDGSIGQTLFSRLGKTCATSEEFILREPDGVLQLHRDYVAAGAELITTNTFTANRLAFAHSGIETRLFEINRRAVELAREAAGDRAWVVGSIGPTGQLMMPYGDLTPEMATEVYAEQAEALSGADLIAIETMSSVEETRAAVEAVRATCGLPIAISFTIDGSLRTMMGTTAAEFVTAGEEWGVEIVGTNCGVGPDEVERVLPQMREAASRVILWGEPNAGLPHVDGTDVVYDLGPDRFADYAEAAAANGARVIGSCCGSTPEHTRAMFERIQSLSS